MPSESPVVTRLSWGSVETAVGKFRDAKLWPGGGRGWDWKETGTNHAPGVQPADVEELLVNGSRVVVLGCGQRDRLGVPAETLAVIDQHGATAEVLGTRRAVERYNELARQGAAVGALIHSTC